MPEQAAICSTVEGLFSHQRVGVNFLYNRKKAILSDDMGLGKTLQSILAAEQLKLEGRADYLLIICPVSLVPNWRRELVKWESSFGASHARIVPYSQLAKLKAIPPKTVVLIDEAHAIKRVESQRTQALIRFAMDQEPNIAALWLLTGTPVTRDNGDLWPLAHLVDHPVAKLFNPMKLRGMKSDIENAMLAGAMKTHLLMRKKTDVLDLPAKIRQVVDVETGIEGGSLEDIRVLMKKSPEALQEHLMRLKRMTAEAKAPATIAHVQEILNAGRKVIVFSDHRESLHEIYEHFRQQGAMPVLIDGSVQDRDTPVQRFQTDSRCRVFCGNIKAAGVGLTLTAASDVVFSDIGWLPADILQAEDRAHRIGTTGTVNVYIMADPNMLIDSIMLRILGNRSEEIASFEQSEQGFMAEVKRWAEDNG
jgi:SNF2 family DNA or RNA helicase